VQVVCIGNGASINAVGCMKMSLFEFRRVSNRSCHHGGQGKSAEKTPNIVSVLVIMYLLLRGSNCHLQKGFSISHEGF
jgi:hypothetical protein